MGPSILLYLTDSGFDIVIEATGSVKILEDAINYCRRGGKLVVYGVYSNAARVTWAPSKIFGDEITILGNNPQGCPWTVSRVGH